MKPYPAMKAAGPKWLGSIPAHWGVVRFKNLLKEMDARSKTGREQLLRVSRFTGVTAKNSAGGADGSDTTSSRAVSLVGHRLVRPGDLVVNIMMAWNGSMGVSRSEGIVSPDYCVYGFVDGSEPWYYHYMLRSPLWKARIMVASTGIAESLFRLYTDSLYRLRALQPPLSEQAGIVRFLDHADRRIQRYIRVRVELIALQEEQKRALIHEAVTGRIDVRTGQPYPAYKDSGVEWLGRVPEHWSVVPVKRIARRIQNGTTPPTSEAGYYEHGTVPWYGPSSCGPKEAVGPPVRHLNEVAFSRGGARLVRGPALLVVVIGATAGRMVLMQQDGSTNQQVTTLELPPDVVSPPFMLRQLRNAQAWLRSTASATTLPFLDPGVLAGLPCAIPPRDEQEVCDRALGSAVDRIDRVIGAYEEEIELQHEFRTRLIADVVTGKLDVRESAAKLPGQSPPSP